MDVLSRVDMRVATNQPLLSLFLLAVFGCINVVQNVLLSISGHDDVPIVVVLADLLTKLSPVVVEEERWLSIQLLDLYLLRSYLLVGGCSPIEQANMFLAARWWG